MTPTKRKSIGLNVGIVVLTAVCTAAMTAGGMMSTVKGYGQRLDNHEARILVIEQKITETHTNVVWIRDFMDKEHP